MTIGDDILGGIIQDFKDELAMVQDKLDRLLVLEEQIKTLSKSMDSSLHKATDIETRVRTLEITTGVERERTSHSLRFVDKFFAVFFALMCGGTGTLIWYLLTHTILRP